MRGPKWESQEVCGTFISPQFCLIGYGPKSHLFYNEEFDGTPLFRSSRHCRKGGWCEEIIPNGRCMQVNKAVKGVRLISGATCGDRTRSHKLIAAQLWHLVRFANGVVAFEVYSLSTFDACTAKRVQYQPVLSETGTSSKLKMLGGKGANCTLKNSQLWGPPSPLPPSARASRSVRTPDWLTGKNASGCKWQARGKHEFITYAYLRMIKDTCSDNHLRIRIAGKCTVAGWKDGNWINDVHQLTSISCPAGQGYFTIVMDYQYWWPKSAKARHGHPRGKVHQITLQ